MVNTDDLKEALTIFINADKETRVKILDLLKSVEKQNEPRDSD